MTIVCQLVDRSGWPCIPHIVLQVCLSSKKPEDFDQLPVQAWWFAMTCASLSALAIAMHV